MWFVSVVRGTKLAIGKMLVPMYNATVCMLLALTAAYATYHLTEPLRHFCPSFGKPLRQEQTYRETGARREAQRIQH